MLHEAEDDRIPLLERVKFIAIVSSNIDEFFQKRIGGLKQQVGAQLHSITPDGRTPQQQIADCLDADHRARDAQGRRSSTRSSPSCKAAGVWIAPYKELDPQQQAWVREYYLRNIFPLVTPQAMDPAHPFPFVSNLSLNLLVSLRYENDSESLLARVKVPVGGGMPRFVRVGTSRTFVDLADVMANNLDLLFPGMEIEACALFRVTRNAITERDEEEADDLLEMIEIELRERKFAPVVRLQVDRDDARRTLRGRLAAELGLDEQADVFEAEGMLGQRDLMEIATLDIPELRDPPHAPCAAGRLPDRRQHLPRDPRREEPDGASPVRVVPAVGRALPARGGRRSEGARDQDDAVPDVEGLRRDQAPRARRAQRQAGRGRARAQGAVRRGSEHQVGDAHGARRHPRHLRRRRAQDAHARSSLVVRQDYDGLRRYAHVATGNYHAGTARLYTDLGLFTCDDGIGRDLTELFNYLTTGYKPRRKYQKLLVAPKQLKHGAAREDRARDRASRAAAGAATSSGSSTRSRTSTSCARCIARRSAA